MDNHQQEAIQTIDALNIPINNLRKCIEDSKDSYIDYEKVKKELKVIYYFLANIDKISYNSYNFVDEIEQEKVIE